MIVGLEKVADVVERRGLQIGGLEVLGEPAEGGCEQRARFTTPPLIPPQARQAADRAELERLGTLRLAQCHRLRKARFDFGKCDRRRQQAVGEFAQPFFDMFTSPSHSVTPVHPEPAVSGRRDAPGPPASGGGRTHAHLLEKPRQFDPAAVDTRLHGTLRHLQHILDFAVLQAL